MPTATRAESGGKLGIVAFKHNYVDSNNIKQQTDVQAYGFDLIVELHRNYDATACAIERKVVSSQTLIEYRDGTRDTGGGIIPQGGKPDPVPDWSVLRKTPLIIIYDDPGPWVANKPTISINFNMDFEVTVYDPKSRPSMYGWVKYNVYSSVDTLGPGDELDMGNAFKLDERYLCT